MSFHKYLQLRLTLNQLEKYIYISKFRSIKNVEKNTRSTVQPIGMLVNLKFRREKPWERGCMLVCFLPLSKSWKARHTQHSRSAFHIQFQFCLVLTIQIHLRLADFLHVFQSLFSFHVVLRPFCM